MKPATSPLKECAARLDVGTSLAALLCVYPYHSSNMFRSSKSVRKFNSRVMSFLTSARKSERDLQALV